MTSATASLLVNIDVADLAQATAFYTAAFGLKIGRRFGDGGVELLGTSAPIYLLVKPAGSVANSASAATRDYTRHWTPVHLDFVVDDLPPAIERALAAGAVLEDPMRSANWGRIAHFADPFGNGFCLLQFLNRGYDEVADPAA
ncbi:MAG: Glyoxalase/bleomycin resistance protein/dioxygenase [Hydrocarboniphaga sp.]|uniref:VOC family protein n=1 Tax=Hydrocarboniphaga sp. TaxID=2033016 RepID=UPI0026053AB1|nr:VOC family protein [Hydrocarboniphaga sp.]MDB5967820.1 Glyoxalase/bleomycin resistance protein/dioxygenase [Hydrocarboniphaga sp.]